MNLAGWMPVRVLRRDDGLRVEWTLIGERRLVEPFFEETIRKQMAVPFHQLFRRETSMDELVAWTDEHAGVPLRGLIYHESRCGSTLLAQQLVELPRNIVASEPPPLDALLRLPLTMPQVPRGTLVRWIRAMVSALGQARHGEEAMYIKMDCWNAHALEWMREAFPAAPWVFLYREPEAVMIQHRQLPAMWLVPGLMDPRVLKLEMSDWKPDAQEVYAARALSNICQSGLHAVEQFDGGLLVNHSELPEPLCGRLREHFGLREEDVPVMRERGGRDAKMPIAKYEGEEAFDREAELVRVRAAVKEHLQPVYAALERVRAKQMQG